MIRPTDEQLAILDIGLEPLRISAGAGTGKTTTIALLVARLVEEQALEPEEILGITFTNKATAELSDRVREILLPLTGPGREAEIHTYHGFANQIVGEFGALVGIERGASVITPTFSRQLLFDVVQHRRFEHFDATWSGSVEKIQRLGSALGDHLADPAEVAAAATPEEPWPERLELLAAWDDYQMEKQRLGVVDYADLVAAAVRLVSEHPDIAGRIRSRYRIALLDEYQDTNPAQRILLQHLFGDGFPVVAVGDVDQTIYEWRGASPDNFESFAGHFPRADGTPASQLQLTVNRRSDEDILVVANSIRSLIGPDRESLQAPAGTERGSVGVRWATDAVAEADWIADEVWRLHEQGTPWSEIAVLFRKNRQIALVHDALTEREIPVEVANLGGLLSVPEVADVRAWMRILQTPEDGPALLRILMGPRMKLGMGDLIHLSDWARQAASKTTREAEMDLDHDRLVGHTMAEAIEHLDSIDQLRQEARSALESFRDSYRLLLETAQSTSLAELARTILDSTGAWRDIDAMGPSGRLTARLNLYRFLDLTEQWSPLEGRPSLAAFLAHLEVMEDNPADELDAARLSGEEAVALLTVHRSKGLEWDVVFIPAVTKGSFPAQSGGFENPYERPQWIPHRFRRDTPPPIDAAMTSEEAKDVLRSRHLEQEWRTAYVAVTRARHRLFLSGAHWYGSPLTTQRPVEPSPLFSLVAGLDVADDLGVDPAPDRPEILRAADRGAAPDPLFSRGWAEAVRDAMAEPGYAQRLADEVGLGDVVRSKQSEFSGRLFDLGEIPTSGNGGSPRATSVTGLVTFAACPRRHYWSEVDRLPRRPSPAARRGVEIHRRIELHSLGQVPIEGLDTATYDVVQGAGDEPGEHRDPYQSYLASEYAARKPLRIEAPFEYRSKSEISIRGRIDAIYPDGKGWEIVDFKSGRRHPYPWMVVQLQAYAVAARRVDFGLDPPEHLTVTFVFLGDGVDVDKRRADAEWMIEAETRIESITSAIAAEEFDPVPSMACRTCEFSRFCPPGRDWLAQDTS